MTVPPPTPNRPESRPADSPMPMKAITARAPRARAASDPSIRSTLSMPRSATVSRMSGIDLSALGASDISGWDLLWAVLASLAGWIASIFVFRGLRTLMRRTPNVTESMALLVARIGRYLVILLGIGVGLAFLGVGVQPLLAIVIILGIVAVLVLRGFADNFAAGVMLQTRHPIKLGDEVQSEGVVGTVVELNGRSVVLHTV